MRHLLGITLVASSLACHADDSSEVRIDLTTLHHRAAQNAFSAVELLVTGSGVKLAAVPLDVQKMSFDLEVPAGPARSFAVEAYNQGEPHRLTRYWGATTVDLVPRTIVDLTIAIGPAGRVYGSVALEDDTPLPARVDLTFTRSEAAAESPGVVVVSAQQGEFSAPLPVGRHRVAARVNVGGRTYTLPEDTFVDISQGQVSAMDLVLSERAAGAHTTVRVVDTRGAPQGDVTLLLHDNTGAFSSETTTNAQGTATVDVAAGGMLTLALSVDDALPTYSLVTAAGVVPGSTIEFTIPSGPNGDVLLGDLNVSLGIDRPAAEVFEVTIGCTGLWPVPVGTSAVALSVYESCVGSDGQVDLLGVAHNGGPASIVAFALLPSQPFSGTTDIAFSTWDENRSALDVSFANPPSGSSFIELSLISYRNQVRFDIGQMYSGPLSNMGPVTFYAPRNFFAYHDVSAVIDGVRTLTRRAIDQASPAAIDLDLGQLLPQLFAPTIDSVTEPARPTVSWTPDVPAAALDVIDIELTFEQSLRWLAFVPPAAGTSWQVPELPESMAAGFKPANYTGSTPAVVIEMMDASSVSGIQDFYTHVGPWAPGASQAAGWPAAPLTLRTTVATANQ